MLSIERRLLGILLNIVILAFIYIFDDTYSSANDPAVKA